MLPNAEKAVVPRAKIVGYLLSNTHPSGKSKAEFFSSFGFSSEAWGGTRVCIEKTLLGKRRHANRALAFWHTLCC